MQATPGAAAAISGQIRSRRRGRGRILFRGGVPRRFRARWRAPAESLHGYDGAAAVRETEVRGEIIWKEERRGEGEGVRSGGEVWWCPPPVAALVSAARERDERARRKKERKETSGRGGGILRGYVGAPVVDCSGGGVLLLLLDGG